MTPAAVILLGVSVIGIWASFTGENPVAILGAILRGEALPKIADRPGIALANETGLPSNLSSGVGEFAHPTGGVGTLGSGFGPRTAPTAGASSFHRGQDIRVPEGTRIFAAHDGTVTRADYSSSYGNVIYLDKRLSIRTGLQTRYAHLRAGGIAVRPGQQVTKGQHIGFSGSTGISTGPHLHYEVRELRDGANEAVDPRPYL